MLTISEIAQLLSATWLLVTLALLVSAWYWLRGPKRVFALGLVTLLFVVWPGYGAATRQAENKTRLQVRDKAMAMWQERCKTAGEKIYKTVEGVEGVYLLKLRPQQRNYAEQFLLDDPFGDDYPGDGYIRSFLHESYGTPKVTSAATPPRRAYAYVEALDPVDGKRYRYTGRLEEPWQADNERFSKGYIRLVLEKTPALGKPPRYGVTYEDTSTREEREYWIAGSSLKVIDLQTNEVIAERIGYMVDRGQGSKAGQRSAWLEAPDTACPAFPGKHGMSAQGGQTEKFVEKVLRPLVTK